MMRPGTISKWPLHWRCSGRFKHKLEGDTVWDQIQRKLIKQSTEEDCGGDGDTMQSEEREWKMRMRVNRLPANCPGRLHWRSCLLRKRHRT
ncbi:unnamed protein product [Arctogadus glacialis]